MENVKIVARLYKSKSVVKTETLHAARMEDGYISATVYDSIKRKMFKLGGERKGVSWRLETEDGRKDTFGGYPASGCLNRVKFE